MQKGTNPRRKCWVSNDVPFIVAAYQVQSVDEGPNPPTEAMPGTQYGGPIISDVDNNLDDEMLLTPTLPDTVPDDD